MNPVTNCLRPLLALASLCLAAGCAAGAIGGAPEPSEFGEPPPGGPLLAAGLEISAITISQSVAIDLLRDGVTAEQYSAPLLTGRAGIVRVFVEPADGWVPRSIRGELILRSGDDERVYEDEEEPEGDSSAESFSSTFDFEFSAADLHADTEIAVRLWEVDQPAEPGPALGDSEDLSRDGAAWPTLGSAPLRATEAGGVVRVMLLPIQYEADGSGRLPDTSAEQIAFIEERLLQLYPVREIELSVAAPHPSDIAMEADGTGFSDLLSSLRDVREQRDVPFETYLHALVSPATNMMTFCGGACTTGMAYRVGDPFSGSFKVGLGLGFEGDAVARILVHELGHQHDRGHAPCGNVGNPDLDFPYDNGGIGVDGWDSLGGERLAAEDYADFMSYCPDRWVSDYTWRALHQRMLAVEGLRSSRETLPRSTFFSFAVDGLGGIRFERREQLRFRPTGPQWPVQLLDDRGLVVAMAEASFVAFADLPGGTLVLPDPGKDVASVRVGGGAPIALRPAATPAPLP